MTSTAGHALTMLRIMAEHPPLLPLAKPGTCILLRG
jgi:hypothetical protein